MKFPRREPRPCGCQRQSFPTRRSPDRLAGLRRGMTVTVRYFVPDLCCPADPPAGRYRTATGVVQALDPIAKTLRLALEGQPKGPGLEKEKVVTIPFAEIETLQGSGG